MNSRARSKAAESTSDAKPNAGASPPASRTLTPWFVYLIECVDGSIYTGIAVDVTARYAAHVSGKGARYTRAHPPARLLASAVFPDRSSASKAEYRIKQLRPAEKRRYAEMLAQQPNEGTVVASVYNHGFID